MRQYSAIRPASSAIWKLPFSLGCCQIADAVVEKTGDYVKKDILSKSDAFVAEMVCATVPEAAPTLRMAPFSLDASTVDSSSPNCLKDCNETAERISTHERETFPEVDEFTPD
jgi:hypothetical protein